MLIQPTTSVPEIVSHMEKANVKALFVCEELLPVCKQIFDRLPTLPQRTYSLTDSCSLREALKVDIKSLAELLREGQGLPKLDHRWMYKGETFNETAYLCATSGTSGRQVWLTISSSLATFRANKRSRDSLGSRTPTLSPTSFRYVFLRAR